MTTTTNTTTAGDSVQQALEATVEVIWNTMWKPWNALIETRFAFIGYIGFLAIALVGFTASVVHYGYSKVKGYLIK